jgi:hypothetical protein
MVDALKRARQWLTDVGCVIDMHPTAAPALVLVGHLVGGEVDNGTAKDRHQAATDAISAAIRDRFFTLESSTEFDYCVYADSLEELQQHIHDEWREGHIGDMTFANSQTLLRADPTQKPRVRERVSASRLVPVII